MCVPVESGAHPLYAFQTQLVLEKLAYCHSPNRLGQMTRVQRPEVDGGITAHFPVYRCIGSNDRQPVCHRLHKRMAERFSDGGKNENICAAVLLFNFVRAKRPGELYPRGNILAVS